MKYLQPKVLKQTLRSPAAITYVICLILFSFNLIKTYHLRPFTSDDVFWQTILQGWHPFNGTTVTLGNSSVYVDKIPYFMFFNHFFDPSRKVLFAEAAIEAIVGFSAFYFACLYFLKKFGCRLSYLTLLPFVWLSSFGYTFTLLYLNPNWRGFQLGISFAVFALVAAIHNQDIKLKTWLSKTLLVIAAAFAGLQTYSDPYFLYFTVAPITLLCVILVIVRKLPKKSFMPIGSALILTLVFAKLTAVLSTKAGIHSSVNYPMQFITFDKLPNNLLSGVHSLLMVAGADFFGANVASEATVVTILNFILLVIAVSMVILLLVRARRLDIKHLRFDKLWPTFFAGLCLLIFISYAISTLSVGADTFRYFLMSQLVFVLLLAMRAGTLQIAWHKTALTVLLVTAVIFNLAFTAIGHNYDQQSDVANNRANWLNYSIIDTIKQQGYTKGYANYWQGDINTYLSKDTVSFLPSLCAGGTTEKFHWLINDSAFSKPATKSFYLSDPDIIAPVTCQIPNLLEQFGQPSKTIYVGDKTILFYDHDITAQIPDFTSH